MRSNSALRRCVSGVGGAERALDAKPAWHLAAHHAAFSAMQVQAAIDFAALPILARQGVAGFAPNP